MDTLLQYLTVENLLYALAGFGSLVAAASILVKLTPNTRDDEIVGKFAANFYKVRDVLVSLLQKLAK